MMRIEIECSMPGRSDDVMTLAAHVTNALDDLARRGAVVHRVTVEEVDA